MHRFVLIFLFALQLVFAADYDCVFVGSSPIPLFEAIYQRCLGKSVLVLEQAGECGGAWKAINICGVEHVDLGCHQIGGDKNLKDFLEVYGGCRIVSMDQPTNPTFTFSGNGFYFSQGCYELIRNLTQLIEITGVSLWLNHRLDSVFVDPSAGHVVLRTQDKQITAKKVFYSQMSSFKIENSSAPYQPHTTKYPHLYLLVQDPGPPKFSYMGYGGAGASRTMNLTNFVGLAGTGRHLLVFQVHGEDALNRGEQYLEDLKKRNLMDPSAYILRAETYTYELAYGYNGGIQPQFQPYFEMLNTSSFAGMSAYIHKWKQVLKPYREIIP